MFGKLRNRFLVLNLATITVIMLVAFASIYMITYQNVHSDIAMELRRVADFHHWPPGSDGPRPDQPPAREGAAAGGPNEAAVGVPDAMPAEGAADRPNAERPGAGSFGSGGSESGLALQQERSISFVLRTDAAWSLLESESKFEMEDGLYALALEKVADSGAASGQFSLDGSHWSYMVNKSGDDNIIVFLDVSARQNILTNLIYTFALVGFVMLIALFFTSRYFANRAIAPVKEAFEKQKQFIADASHELKTPLTIINTNADVLLSGGEDAAGGQTKWLQYIKSETERMTRLTNDLLYLTEMDDYRVHMVFAKFNMSEAVENIMLTMEAVLFEKNVTLEYSIEPELRVNGNSEQIKQVVMILLDNAAKYTPPQGTVTLALKKQQHEAALTVSNTGDGIAAEHLPRIFDRFYRTDASRARKQGGYGLGLAIAKSIVDQHKGRIYAGSVPGESTTFHVHLPLG